MRKNIILSLLLIQGCSYTAQTETESLDKATVHNMSSGIKQGNQSMQKKIRLSQWQLVSYLSGQSMQSVVPENPATLLFSRRKVSGNAGCNQYFASYQFKQQNGVQFSQAGSTMMGCPTKIAEQERQYLKNLAAIHFYQLDDGQLQLIDSQQQIRLIYKAMPALTLQGTTWQATGINNGHGGVVSNAYTEQAYLQFTDGRMQGSSGCNTLTASYQNDTDDLTIASVHSSRKSCREKDLMLQEQQIVQALQKVTRYEIRTNQLRLLNESGSLMMSLQRK